MRWALLLLAAAACGKKDASPAEPPARPVPQLAGVRWTGDLEIELELMLPSKAEGGGRFSGHRTTGVYGGHGSSESLAVWMTTSAEPGDEFVLMSSTQKVEAAAPGRYPLRVTHQYKDEESRVEIAGFEVEVPLEGPPEPHVLALTSPDPGKIRMRALIPAGETRSRSRWETKARHAAREVRFYLTAGLVKGQKLRLRETDLTATPEKAGRWTASVHFASVELGANDDLKAPARDAFREIAREELVVVD